MVRTVQIALSADPANKALEILTLKSGACHLHCSAEEKGRLESQVLPGFAFDLAAVQHP